VERERGRKGATGETEQGRQEGWEAALVLVPGARGEREGRGLYGGHAGVQNTLGLKLETKRP
jgi:hypothetical protein